MAIVQILICSLVFMCLCFLIFDEYVEWKHAHHKTSRIKRYKPTQERFDVCVRATSGNPMLITKKLKCSYEDLYAYVNQFGYEFQKDGYIVKKG